MESASDPDGDRASKAASVEAMSADATPAGAISADATSAGAMPPDAMPDVSPASAASDAALVAAATAGDRRAFARLYERFGPVVHGSLIARVPAQDAADLVQDVFVTALRRLDSLRRGESVGGWLLAIARARAADYWRESAPQAELSEAATHSDERADPLARRDAARVVAALRELPDAYREVLAMRLVEGLRGPEIAERTGLRAGSVRVNLHRGMALLREKLGGREP
jgi:RNA polymerase sigma-70 factor, ECF subfamily